MIEKYCSHEKLENEIINQSDYEIILRVQGTYKDWKWLAGYHKIVRVSPFGRGDKVHTSLCRIMVSNPEKRLAITVQDKDIREDFFKSTGPGGQHRNKSMTAVRLTHIPTNTVTVSCAERSQYNNRMYAMEQLIEKLKDQENKLQQINQEDKRSKSLSQKQTILTFYYNHKMVVNEHSGIKTTKLKEVLNGQLNFIK